MSDIASAITLLRQAETATTDQAIGLVRQAIEKLEGFLIDPSGDGGLDNKK